MGGLPHIKSKKLRAQAVTTDKPSKYLPDVREKLENQGFEIIPGSSDESRAFTAAEVEKFGKLTVEGNITKE